MPVVIKNEKGEHVWKETGEVIPKEWSDFLNEYETLSDEEKIIKDVEFVYHKLKDFMDDKLKLRIFEWSELPEAEAKFRSEVFGLLDMSVLQLGNHSNKFKKR